MAITYERGLAFVRGFAAAIAENKDYLTQLDSEIGDADHGTNMDRGMQAVLPKVGSLEGADLAQLFKTTAMTLISTVGGASGPLYGTLFLQLGTTVTGKTELSAEDWSQALDAAVQAVRARGKAQLGDKTMIDALQPAADSLRDAAQDGATLEAALVACEQAAEQGMQATIPLVARKGRASYLGERSAGHQDPGPTSSWLLVRAARQAFTADT
jgi:dihydroxyacetone kinase-like protein